MSDATCRRPPDGWYCTREPNHEGPCAAWPAMEPCTGCKFLVRLLGGMSACRARDVDPAYVHNPLSGATEIKYYWRPTLEQMRSVGQPCGPDRKLYEPSFWTRVKSAITRDA